MNEATQKTRDRLIENAANLFHDKGFYETSVAEILRGADANSGSLYYFFKNKKDLLLAVISRYQEVLYPAIIEPAFSQESDPIERIFSILAQYRRFLSTTGCTRGCPIGNLAIEVADEIPLAREKIADTFASWRRWVKRCLDEAGDRLPPEINRTQLAAFVLTVMEGGVMQARAFGSLEPFDDSVTQLRDYMNRLIAGS
jgi:TetR/AcrR family transcriptional repressor of nem operon